MLDSTRVSEYRVAQCELCAWQTPYPVEKTDYDHSGQKSNDHARFLGESTKSFLEKGVVLKLGESKEPLKIGGVYGFIHHRDHYASDDEYYPPHFEKKAYGCIWICPSCKEENGGGLVNRLNEKFAKEAQQV